MLLQFNLANYLSVKDEIVLTAFANSGKEHEDSLIHFKKERILPSLALYGANAAGKTNIFRALSAAVSFVRKSSSLQVGMPTELEPFLFDEKTKEGKTKMDFIFVHKGKKFQYGFLADRQYVYEEYLYEYRSSRPAMIFERTDITDYRFTASYRHLAQFSAKNTANKLFMCTATAWNCEETRDAYLWFAEGIETYSQKDIRNNRYSEYLKQNKDRPETKEFLLSLLRHAEINITDYEFRDDQTEHPLYGRPDHSGLDTLHQIIQSDGSLRTYRLPFERESDGTMILFAYGPIIMEALEKGKTIVIDELNNNLHSNLSRYLVGLFNDPSVNPNGAQLIFNSHDISLLDLGLFRRDQIYFAEKDNRTGITDLYSLADFSPRKSENIQKGYLQGRYGAIPFVEGGVEW